jgi:hypothetical protein
MRRVRFKMRQMMLAILALGMMCGGGELARRHIWSAKEPEPPEWPWFPGPMNHFEVTYVNMDDVAKGIKPPRTRSVLYWNPKKTAAPQKPKPSTVTKEVRQLKLVPDRSADPKP